MSIMEQKRNFYNKFESIFDLNHKWFKMVKVRRINDPSIINSNSSCNNNVSHLKIHQFWSTRTWFSSVYKVGPNTDC